MKISKFVPSAPPTFTLILNEEEARTLKCICGKISGSSTRSRRKHASEVYDELGRLGVADVPREEATAPGSIYFNDTEESL